VGRDVHFRSVSSGFYNIASGVPKLVWMVGLDVKTAIFPRFFDKNGNTTGWQTPFRCHHGGDHLYDT
jgi:hypothetical protein